MTIYYVLLDNKNKYFLLSVLSDVSLKRLPPLLKSTGCANLCVAILGGNQFTRFDTL